MCMAQVREASEARAKQQQEKQQLQNHVEQLQESMAAAIKAKDAVQEAAQEKLARLSQLEGEPLHAGDVWDPKVFWISKLIRSDTAS